jgi:hypothetical protein
VYFVVLKATGTQTNGLTTDGAGTYILDRTTATTPLASLKVSGGAYGFQKRFDSNTGIGGPTSITPVSQSNFQIVAMRRKTSTLQFEIWVNGVLEGTVADTGAAITVPALNIGHHATAGNTQGFVGEIAEILVYNSELSATDFASVGSYLEAEYGIDSAFPGIPRITTLGASAPSYYFRKSFSFSGNPAESLLHLTHTVADGAVFYLNGAELTRRNMPAGAVGHSTLASSPISSPAAISVADLPATALVNGTNVLAVSLHKATGSTGAYLDASVRTVERKVAPAPSLAISEIAAAGSPGFFVELRNQSSAPLDTTGWTLVASTGQSVAIPAQTIAAGGYLVLTSAELGYFPIAGTRLSLWTPGNAELRDSREVTNRLRGLVASGAWGFPTTPTSGGVNVATVSDAIVINEIFYKAADPTPPALPSGEQWVELYNKSAAPVDVSGWSFTEGISYTFPAMTPPIPAGGFAVVAWNPTTFATLHPGVTSYGPFSGSLSGKGEQLKLADANGNTADEVRYHDGGRWSQWADGGGSSLELIDPDSDNSKGEAWDASDESAQSTWQTVSYSGLATNNPSNNPITWNEFLFGLLNNGEFLIDDIVVANTTQGISNLIQNGTFSGGNTNTWRIIGTHSGSVVPDPTAPGNNVLKVVATAETEHMHNNAGTTLKNGASFHTMVATDNYSISFRAKWLRGSNALHSRLYMNRLPRKTLLNRPTTGGTPGAVNSRFNANIGPTFDALSHLPAVPLPAQSATVSVTVADPDNVSSVQLFTSLNGAAFSNSGMSTTGAGVYTGTVPGQAAGAQVQFYIQATDSLGAVSVFPPGGAASRAMIPWADGREQLTLASGAKPHNIRVVMPAADATELYRKENQMSNGSRPCTVIMNETDVYYRVGVALKSSEHGRFNVARVGYNLEFPPDGLFLGVHGGVAIDRSGGTTTGQREILLKTLSILAGGIHAPQDDLIRIIPAVGPKSDSAANSYDGSAMLGAAILSKTRLKGDYLDNQWENGGDGMMFKYERIYVLTETINPTTRVVDTVVVPENPKIPQDTSAPPGVTVMSLGSSSEVYRWHWLVESGRDTDNYTPIMDVTNAIGQTGGSVAFNTLTEQTIDINPWLRAHVPGTLYGTTDNYLAPGGAGSLHNVLFYFPPGRKAQLLPWDMDFLNQSNPTTTSLENGGDIAKFIANPVWKRLYYGHMLDVLNRSFNTATMTYWATHYSRFGTDDMVGSVSAYLTPRVTHAMNRIYGINGQTAAIAPVTFARTSASPTTVSTPFATVSGNGWINIAEIRLLGASEPLAVTWTGENTWTLQLPISAGTNTYTLVAYDSTGASLGTTSVTVTANGGVFPATVGNLAVTEIHYNPAGTTDATEFIELLNVTGSTLDLTNCHFDEELGQGIAFTFTSGTQVAAGARIIVARDRAAFIAAYPAVPTAQIAMGQFIPSALDNSGERIVLYSASGLPIFDFSYSDGLAPTDGGGRSMVRVVSSTAPNWTTYLWRASTADGGNPNTTDTLAFAGAAAADGDLDGIPALLEYALGTSDSSFDSQPFTTTRNINGNLVLNFNQRTNADDVDLVIESVADLGTTWAPAAANKTSDTTIGTLRSETWEVAVPIGVPRYFVRLKATLR